MDLYLNGRKIIVQPQQAVGKGGEADVFQIDKGIVLKLFKSPDHPDFRDDPLQQEGARRRILVHQQKLPLFPQNLPDRVITPIDLVFDRKQGGEIRGYTMRYLADAELLFQYGVKKFRDAGISNNAVLDIFRDMHPTVQNLHQAGVIVGDFKPLNILVENHARAYFIDADSFQFGSFDCRVFTALYLDPLIADPAADQMTLFQPYNEHSDWYAYTVMLLNCFLLIHPYLGIYRPKNPKFKIKDSLRPLHRISVFHSDVSIPSWARHFRILSDDLLHYFEQVFTKDARGIFPLQLLQSMRWTKCAGCGMEHARHLCPHCQIAPPAAVKQTIVIHGQVTATRIFQTRGLIVKEAYQNNRLQFLVFENHQFRREDGSIVTTSDIAPQMRFRLQGERTLIGFQNRVAIFQKGIRASTETFQASHFNSRTMFDVNERSVYWIENGTLRRSGNFGPERIGDVLDRQSVFWVGQEFGFGFSRAGLLSLAFVFEAQGNVLNDRVILPRIPGQLLDASCVFSKTLAWLFVSSQDGPFVRKQCFVIDRGGRLIAHEQTTDTDHLWLGKIHGNSAIGNSLFVATVDGVIRLEPDASKIQITREFPDTKGFVDDDSSLCAAKEGLYAVKSHEILLLTIQHTQHS